VDQFEFSTLEQDFRFAPGGLLKVVAGIGLFRITIVVLSPGVGNQPNARNQSGSLDCSCEFIDDRAGCHPNSGRCNALARLVRTAETCGRPAEFRVAQKTGRAGRPGVSSDDEVLRDTSDVQDDTDGRMRRIGRWLLETVASESEVFDLQQYEECRR
jgi:hypothetical protein